MPLHSQCHPLFDNDVPARFWELLSSSPLQIWFLTRFHYQTISPILLIFRAGPICTPDFLRREPIPSQEEILQHHNVWFLDPWSLAILHTFLQKEEKNHRIRNCYDLESSSQFDFYRHGPKRLNLKSFPWLESHQGDLTIANFKVALLRFFTIDASYQCLPAVLARPVLMRTRRRSSSGQEI